jgi:hypothetical protein
MSVKTLSAFALRHWWIPVVLAGGMNMGACTHHHHDDRVVITDEHGWRHEGSYDADHHWHGGYYDDRHEYHDDPADWHH